MAVLEITFDSNGLSKIIAAGQSVTLTRTVGQVVESMALSSAAAAKPAVVWQAFSPLATNTVSWTDSFYCYATTTALAVGNVITINSESSVPMVTGALYAFAQGQFVQRTAPASSSYIVGNATPSGSYAFGLVETATINNVASPGPLCAMPVLYNEAVYLNPSDLIAIFLSSATAAGTLIPPPNDPFTIAISASSGADPVIGFNDQTNTFYQMS